MKLPATFILVPVPEEFVQKLNVPFDIMKSPFISSILAAVLPDLPIPNTQVETLILKFPPIVHVLTVDELPIYKLYEPVD